MKRLSFLVLVVCLIGTACERNNSSDDNILQNPIIEDLYAQPLPIIQKSVQGQWKGIRGSRWGSGSIFNLTNITVNIDTKNNNLFITADTSKKDIGLLKLINSPSSYSWEKKEVYGSDVIGERPTFYTTYVMQFNEMNIEEPALRIDYFGWYFKSIRNDTLRVFVDFTPADFNFCYYENYYFVRIKDNDDKKME